MTESVNVCLIDGTPADRAGVAPSDRGLRYGDGVFETLAIVDHQPTLWDRHINRLTRGAERLGFALESAADCFSRDLAALTLPATGVLRLTLTRGSGGAGYAPPAHPQPRRITQVLEAPVRPAGHWQNGVAVIELSTQLACQPALAGIKHLNRLEQVLARQEWRDPGIAEGLMRSTQGALIEATAANLIVEQGGGLLIPDTQACGVDGVMQMWVIEQAQALGIPIQRTQLNGALRADQPMMLCNSLIGLWPVATVDAKPWAWPRWYAPLAEAIDQARIALTPSVCIAP